MFFLAEVSVWQPQTRFGVGDKIACFHPQTSLRMAPAAILDSRLEISGMTGASYLWLAYVPCANVSMADEDVHHARNVGFLSR